MSTLSQQSLRRSVAAILFASLALAVQFVGDGSIARADQPDQQDAVQSFNRDVFWLDGSTLRNPDATTQPGVPLFNLLGIALGVTWGGGRRRRRGQPHAPPTTTPMSRFC